MRLKRKIKDKLYSFDILLLIGYSKEYVAKKYNLGNTIDNATQALTIMDGSGTDVTIWFKDFKFTTQCYADLTHELLHATFFILSDRGVKVVEGGTNEAFTYYLAWLYKSASDIINNVHRSRTTGTNKGNKVLGKSKK